MGKVAVIMRTRNRPILLARAVNSVLSQTFKNYSWIVVNDGGDPREVERLCEPARKAAIQFVMIHRKTSQGMEAASNHGIRESDSKYVVVHDDDDSWEPTFLEATVSMLEDVGRNAYGGVVTRSMRVDETIEGDRVQVVSKRPYNPWLSQLFLSDLAKANMFPPISFVYRRSIWEKVGGYNEELPVLGDWEFNLKFMLEADIEVIPLTLANYHWRISHVGGNYQNSLTQSTDPHQRYEVVIRNALLREDILRGKIGLGYLVNLERDHQGIMHMLESSRRQGVYDDIKRIVKTYGLRGVLASILRGKDRTL